MSGPRENGPGHPLEEVTAGKDVPPGEEGEQQAQGGSRVPGTENGTGPGTGDTTAAQE